MFFVLVSIQTQAQTQPMIADFKITNPTGKIIVPTAGLDFKISVTLLKDPNVTANDMVIAVYVLPNQPFGTDPNFLGASVTITNSDWINNGTRYEYTDKTFHIDQSDLNGGPGKIYTQLESPDGSTVYGESVADYMVNVPTAPPTSPSVHGATVVNTISYNGLTSGPVLFDPSSIIGDPITVTGGSVSAIRWQYSVKNETDGFQSFIPSQIGQSYNPPPLNQTTYFRRRALIVTTDGTFFVFDSNVITITINGGIGVNIIKTNGPLYFDSNANNSNPQLIFGSYPAGGTGSYTYQWQSAPSSNPTNWTNIASATQINYDPPVINATTRFRRMVFSGTYQATSNEIEITVLNNDAISFSSGNVDQKYYYTNPANPSNVIGALIGGTDKTIEYYWLESIDNATWHTVWGTDGTSHAPDPIVQTTYYQREAIIKDELGAEVYQARSNSIVAYVYSPLGSNTICCDQTVYGTATPLQIGGNAVAGGLQPIHYLWYISTDNSTWTNVTAGTLMNNGLNYIPPSGYIGNVYYKRVAYDDAGWGVGTSSSSNSVKINYVNNIPFGATVTNPILTSTFDINCQEVLKSVDATAPGFSHQRGGPANDAYFKVISSSTNLGVNSCQSTVATKQYLYDASFNPMSFQWVNSDCFAFVNLSAGTYYVMVEGNGTLNVQFATYSYGDCADSYQGFYWLNPGFGSGDSESMALNAIYPNPAENTATLKLSKAPGETRRVLVYNKHNALVKSFETVHDEIAFSVEDLVPDVYYIRIEGTKKSETHRLVVK